MKVSSSQLTSQQRKDWQNEADIMAHVDHPNLISFVEGFQCSETLKMCIVMEYADDCDLQ